MVKETDCRLQTNSLNSTGHPDYYMICPWQKCNLYTSNSHYNRLTQIQSLLFCYLFIIQLKITKWTKTCVIQYKEIIWHAIWIKWSLISPKIKILLINLGVIF